MKDLAGKVAFITGGGSGVALGQAKAFAAHGMKIVIADIRQDHLDSALAWFREKNLPVHGIRLDITDRKAYAAAADEAEKAMGPVQLLCNTAGVSQFGPVQQATYDDWDWQMSVNLGGMINGIQTFIPRMLKHGLGAHIVNTASMAGIPAAARLRYLLHHEVRGARTVGMPAARPGAAGHRRVGALSWCGEYQHSRGRAHASQAPVQHRVLRRRPDRHEEPQGSHFPGVRPGGSRRDRGPCGAGKPAVHHPVRGVFRRRCRNASIWRSKVIPDPKDDPGMAGREAAMTKRRAERSAEAQKKAN